MLVYVVVMAFEGMVMVMVEMEMVMVEMVMATTLIPYHKFLLFPSHEDIWGLG